MLHTNKFDKNFFRVDEVSTTWIYLEMLIMDIAGWLLKFLMLILMLTPVADCTLGTRLHLVGLRWYL